MTNASLCLFHLPFLLFSLLADTGIAVPPPALIQVKLLSTDQSELVWRTESLLNRIKTLKVVVMEDLAILASTTSLTSVQSQLCPMPSPLDQSPLVNQFLRWVKDLKGPLVKFGSWEASNSVLMTCHFSRCFPSHFATFTVTQCACYALKFSQLSGKTLVTQVINDGGWVSQHLKSTCWRREVDSDFPCISSPFSFSPQRRSCYQLRHSVSKSTSPASSLFRKASH